MRNTPCESHRSDHLPDAPLIFDVGPSQVGWTSRLSIDHHDAAALPRRPRTNPQDTLESKHRRNGRARCVHVSPLHPATPVPHTLLDGSLFTFTNRAFVQLLEQTGGDGGSGHPEMDFPDAHVHGSCGQGGSRGGCSSLVRVTNLSEPDNMMQAECRE